jgi:long-subunit fatty acid transport protein
MGNAFVALSNDFSASVFNPAGFGLINRMELVGGLNYNLFKNNTSFFNQNTNVSNENQMKVNDFGIVLPFPTTQGSFVLAFGYNQVKDFNKVLGFSGYNGGNNSYIQDLTSYNDDIAFKLALSYPIYDSNNKYLNDVTLISGKLNQSGKILQGGSLNSWTFSGSLEIQQDLFVGATLNIYSGAFNKTRDYSEEDFNNVYPYSVRLDPAEPNSADFQSFRFRDIIDWDISGAGLKLGALYKMENNITVGATIKIPTTFTIKESYYVSAASRFAVGNFNYSPSAERLEYKISTPAEFSAGISYSRNNLTLSGSATMIDYSKMKFENGSDIGATADKNADIVDFMRSVVNLNAGFEYILSNNKIAIRGGFMFMPSPFKDDPADFNKKFATAGVGYYFTKSASINFAYVYGWWKDVGDNYGFNVSRTFQDVNFTQFVTSFKIYL